MLFEAVEEALVTAYKKNFGSSQNVRVDLNRTTGELHVYAQKHVVENVEDDANELSLADARKIDPRYELDDIVEQEVTPKNFGRIAAQNAKAGSNAEKLWPHCSTERKTGCCAAYPRG